MELSIEAYNNACRDYDQDWAATDKVLYELCRQFPDHQRRDGVMAKLWIIGRTYATGIERQIKSLGTQGSSMSQLANHIWRRRDTVDDVLRLLADVKEPLDVEKLKTILLAHGRSSNVIGQLLRENLSPRSFASK